MSDIRILIVDDHPLMREALEAAIAAEPGMQVVGQAGSGREAVLLTHELNPDVILMDLLMPEMDGEEMLKKLRTETWGKDLKVIILTNMGESEAPDSIREMHVEAFIRDGLVADGAAKMFGVPVSV